MHHLAIYRSMNCFCLLCISRRECARDTVHHVFSCTNIVIISNMKRWNDGRRALDHNVLVNSWIALHLKLYLSHSPSLPPFPFLYHGMCVHFQFIEYVMQAPEYHLNMNELLHIDRSVSHATTLIHAQNVHLQSALRVVNMRGWAMINYRSGRNCVHTWMLNANAAHSLDAK